MSSIFSAYNTISCEYVIVAWKDKNEKMKYIQYETTKKVLAYQEALVCISVM